jgi:hypothetical protein
VLGCYIELISIVNLNANPEVERLEAEVDPEASRHMNIGWQEGNIAWMFWTPSFSFEEAELRGETHQIPGKVPASSKPRIKRSNMNWELLFMAHMAAAQKPQNTTMTESHVGAPTRACTAFFEWRFWKACELPKGLCPGIRIKMIIPIAHIPHILTYLADAAAMCALELV